MVSPSALNNPRPISGYRRAMRIQLLGPVRAFDDLDEELRSSASVRADQPHRRLPARRSSSFIGRGDEIDEVASLTGRMSVCVLAAGADDRNGNDSQHGSWISPAMAGPVLHDGVARPSEDFDSVIELLGPAGECRRSPRLMSVVCCLRFCHTAVVRCQHESPTRRLVGSGL